MTRLREGLKDVITAEDGELDEDGIFVLHDDVSSTQHEDVSEGVNPTLLQVSMYKERFERTRSDLEKAWSQLAKAQKEIQQLKQQASALNETTRAKSESDSQLEMQNLRSQVAALKDITDTAQADLAAQRKRFTSLCKKYDQSQADKTELQLRWDRLRNRTKAHVEHRRQQYPSQHGEYTEVPTRASDDAQTEGQNGQHDLVEDVVYLKQAINDAIIKTFAGIELATKKPSQAQPEPLSLREDSVSSFVQALQSLVQFMNRQLRQKGNGNDTKTRMQIEQLRGRLVASEACREKAMAEVSNIGEEFSRKLLVAREDADELRRQRTAGETRQDRLLEQVC